MITSSSSTFCLQIFYAAAYGRVEAVKYLLETLPDKGLGVQFGLQWVRGDIHGGTTMFSILHSFFINFFSLLFFVTIT